VPGYDTDGDGADVAFLATHPGLTTAAQVLDIVARCYPPRRITAKTQFFVERIIVGMQK
jgi:hypothetical protein